MTRHRQRRLAGFDENPDCEKDGSEASEVEVSGASTAAASQQGTIDLTGQTAYVVDAHALIYQVFHAMPDMSSPTGQPVGAVHGFTRDMLDLLEKCEPDYLLCAFDHSDQTFRHELYDQYKIKRESMPDDLRPQIPAIRRVLDALGITSLDCPSYEADDILATLARVVESHGGRCLLVTNDKDCRQLITEQVQVYNIRKDELMDAAGLWEVWGVRPEQVVDFQALVGDSVDNVPGVPLIGPKIAKELLQKYGTLENVLDHASEVSGTKRRANLEGGREQAMLSRRLVRLDDQVPVHVDWQAERASRIDLKQARELFREFGFRRLGERIEKIGDAQSEDQAAPVEWVADYQLVATEAALADVVARMSQQPRIAVDTETTSTNPRWAELVGFSFAWQAGVAFYVPLRAPRGEPRIEAAAAIKALRPVLENAAVEKVGQNLKYDIVALRSAGVELRGAVFDTMVADYLLSPGERNHDMDDLAKRYLKHETTKISELIGTGKNQKQMDEVPLELVTHYAAEDADVPWRLARMLEQRLEEEELGGLFRDLEMPLIEVLAEMEFNGIKVDVERLADLSARFGEKLDRLEREIFKLAGHEFNIDSRQQLGEVLFEELELPVVKRTKTGPSTDADVLMQLAPLHELPAKIIEYRQNAKLKSTYVDALPQLVHPTTGRVHTSFKQDVAATGRLSSKDPNLQNIPIRNEEGREIRSAFLAGEPGWHLLAADYSQIELRVLSHFSGDEALLAAFSQDQDIHARVASEVFDVPLEDVSSQMRRRAKAVNFGVIYGQTPFGLAKSLGISKEEAAEFIDAYFARYQGVAQFIDQVLEESRLKGYVSTISGRRRAIEGVRDPRRRGTSHYRNLPERIAVNTVIQGSAADVIKQAMIALHRRLRREQARARMLLQIHDELVFESPPEDVATLASLVTEEMTAAADLAVPLKVDIKTGTNWAACEPWQNGPTA